MVRKTKDDLVAEAHGEKPGWWHIREKIKRFSAGVSAQDMFVHFFEAVLAERADKSAAAGRPGSGSRKRKGNTYLDTEDRIGRAGFVQLCRNFLNIPDHPTKGVTDQDLHRVFSYIDNWDRVPQQITGGQWVQFLEDNYVAQEAYPEAEFKLKFEGIVPGVNPDDDALAAEANEGVLTMEQMKSHLSAETPKSAELMLKHGVLTEEEFEALGIPLKALTPGFRTVRERRDAAKAAREEEARQKAAAEAAKEAAAAEAERRRKDALPHISEKQPPPKWLLTAAADAFDETTGELKLQRRRFVDGNADFAVGGASAGDDSDEDLVDVIPDRFFQLPSEIDFRDSHLVQNSRYYQRLKQHQDRQRKFIEQAKIKHLAEWRQRMATVFPSFGMQEQLKQFDEARGGGNLSKLKELLRTDDESQ